MAGDDVGIYSVAEHRKTSVQVHLPERFPEFMFRALRNIIDQHVKPAFFAANPGDQLFNLVGLQVVDHHGYAFSSARGDHFGGLLDGLRAVFVMIRGQSHPCVRGTAP